MILDGGRKVGESWEGASWQTKFLGGYMRLQGELWVWMLRGKGMEMDDWFGRVDKSFNQSNLFYNNTFNIILYVIHSFSFTHIIDYHIMLIFGNYYNPLGRAGIFQSLITQVDFLYCC